MSNYFQTFFLWESVSEMESINFLKMLKASRLGEEAIIGNLFNFFVVFAIVFTLLFQDILEHENKERIESLIMFYQSGRLRPWFILKRF